MLHSSLGRENSGFQTPNELNHSLEDADLTPVSSKKNGRFHYDSIIYSPDQPNSKLSTTQNSLVVTKSSWKEQRRASIDPKIDKDHFRTVKTP